MAANPQSVPLDTTDVEILRLLQEDGRMSTAEVARAIHMSATATADRIKRLGDEGVIRGYRAVVDPVALGYPLLAFVRLRRVGSNDRFLEFLSRTPAIREAHHVTGEDCCLIRIVAASMPDLELVVSDLTAFGHVTTNVVFTTYPLDSPLLPAGAPAVT